MNLFFVQNNNLKKKSLFPIVNWAISHCFTMVHMTAIHHCAKEQHAQLNVA